MSENQVLNSTPNLLSKPSPTRKIPTSPKSNTHMEAALEKQKQILDQYKETNAALKKYKEKTEQSISQSKQDLEDEKNKTTEMMKEISMNNEEVYNQKKQENDEKIQELKESPLFESEPIQSMKNSCTEMKSNVEDLKNNFSQNFQNFIDDFHSIQSQVLSKNNEDQSALDELKESIANLQKAIEEKRISNSEAALLSQKLGISDKSISYDREQPASTPVNVVERSVEISEDEKEPQEYTHTPHLTAFLKRYCAKYAKWLV